MNFHESLEYLYGLGNEVLAMKLGLENIRKLLAALGNPEKKFLKIQVAGTNGKGSTCAFLDAICVSAGIKTGLYTSPHLVSITERIKIGGAQISRKDFAEHAAKIRKVSEELVENGKRITENERSKIQNPKSKIYLETVPTFFEQMTAIALSFFAEAGVELAILETGLGGRFDATTAARAKIAAITPVDYDHQKILGDTLEEIAAEKAAIIRENMKVVIAEQRDAARKIIFARRDKFGITSQQTNFPAKIVGKNHRKFIVNFQTKKAEYKNICLSLAGRHQIENAKTAILLAEILQDYFQLKSADIITGLQTATHNGRLEFRENFLFDGAHNIGGAKALREFLDEFVKEKITLVFGAMRDKDLSEIAVILFPKADRIIFTEPANPRSLTTEELIKFLPEDFNGKNVFQTKNVKNAIEKAREISSENHLILVTGSLYLIGEAQKQLAQKNKNQAAG
ncbi:MAG: bifunctional folylpolyglutamate synthase/dihydrofolate synthase [Pyrinomonadaceae bacterium]